MYFLPIYPISQYLHPKETAMLDHRKKKLKQDPIPKKKKPSGLSVAFHLFFILFFCSLNGAGRFCKRSTLIL